MQFSEQSQPGVHWHRLAPLLEEAMARLGPKERDAVVMRYFENSTVREVAAALGLHEDAAQKRVNRGTEKLREYFVRRGVQVSTTALLASIGTYAVQAAPAHLANTISAVTLVKGAAASPSTLTLAKGALKIMAWTKTKTTIVGLALALSGMGTTTLVVEALLPVPDLQGTWECLLTVPAPGWGVHKGESPKMPLVLRITETNGVYQADNDNLGKGLRFGFDSFTYKYPSVHGEFHPSLHGDNTGPDLSVTGKVNRSGRKMAWRAREGTNAFAMVWRRTSNPPPFPEPLTEAEFAPRAGSNLQGFWAGTIGHGKGGLRIQIKIAEAADETFRADFYVPDQDPNRQPTAVSYDGTTVKLMPLNGYGMFEGQLHNGDRELAGNWIQGGRLTPTTLTQANYSEFQGHAAK